MLERLTRIASALLTVVLFFFAAEGVRGDTENSPPAAGPADIELRKSFRSIRRTGRPAARSEKPKAATSVLVAPDEVRQFAQPQIGAVAAALGEQLQTSGTLHLPGVGDQGIVLQISRTPILETATGRHLIIDRDRTIDTTAADGINRRWPEYTVVQPPAGAKLHDVIGSMLDAAGYDTVLRSAPLIFGRESTVRVTPDFVVLRGENDILSGETRAISVVNPADALPAELRELAGEHQVRIVDLTPDGAPAWVDREPSLAPAGKVLTVETARLAPIIEKIASAVGLSAVRGVPLPASVGVPGVRADLGISGDGVAALVFEKADPRSQELLVGRGFMAIWLNSAGDLPEAIASLLKRFGIAAIGPTVEFFRTPTPGSTRRFVISVPGWLAESGGRRLLITGTELPDQVRLFLTREGFDILEYRILL